MRASAFHRFLDSEVADLGDPRLSRYSSLPPSLLEDLLRFEKEGHSSELLEVVAAAVRHARALTVYLELGDRVAPLTLFPSERLALCPLPVDDLLRGRAVLPGAESSDGWPLDALRVLRVEPAPARAGSAEEVAPLGDPAHLMPMGQLSWALSMHGAREDLLPEISGPVAYRLAPGTLLREVNMDAGLRSAVQRLQRGAANLRDMATWPELGKVRASRLLNALYLQAGLIVSRVNAAARSA